MQKPKKFLIKDEQFRFAKLTLFCVLLTRAAHFEDILIQEMLSKMQLIKAKWFMSWLVVVFCNMYHLWIRGRKITASPQQPTKNSHAVSLSTTKIKGSFPKLNEHLLTYYRYQHQSKHLCKEQNIFKKSHKLVLLFKPSNKCCMKSILVRYSIWGFLEIHVEYFSLLKMISFQGAGRIDLMPGIHISLPSKYSDQK